MAISEGERLARIEGGLLGLLIGDALGVPYEFHGPQAIPPKAQIEFAPPTNYYRSHYGTEPGAWSDDGATALALLDSLLTCGRFDAEDLGARLVAWRDQGRYAVNERVFDIGVQTDKALTAIAQGTPALAAGSTEERALGNGSLMRVLPLVLWSKGSDAELIADAMAQSRVTHGHLRAQICCALYCLWARGVLDTDPDAAETDPWANAVATLRAMWDESTPERAELEFHIRPDDPAEGQGQGYVVDALRSARWAVETALSYEGAVKSAVGLGNDTDTTACIAGGVAGLLYGVGAIPQRWRAGLRGQEIYEPLRDALLAWRDDG